MRSVVCGKCAGSGFHYTTDRCKHPGRYHSCGECIKHKPVCPDCLGGGCYDEFPRNPLPRFKAHAAARAADHAQFQADREAEKAERAAEKARIKAQAKAGTQATARS